MLLEEAVVVPLWNPVDSGIRHSDVHGVCPATLTRRSILDPQLLTGVSVGG